MENDDTSGEFTTPFKFIVDHFEKRDLRTLSVNWERKSLFFQMFERQVVMGCSFLVSEDDHMLQILLRYPFIVADPKMRPSVAELVARANFGLKVGTFEFDLKDGEVRYHITHLLENLTIGEELLLRLFNTGMSTTDRYFSAFMQHIYSGVTAEDAVYMVELDLHADAIQEMPTQEKKAPPIEGKKQTKKRSSRKKQKSDTLSVQPQIMDESRGINPQAKAQPTQSSEPPQSTKTPEGKVGDGEGDER